MNRIDKALHEFFDVNTIKGCVRILGALVVGFLAIWYLQDIFAFTYDAVGFEAYERSIDMQRYHRAVGGAMVLVGGTASFFNIYAIYREDRKK
ncbi:hypothetical protein LCGC14_0192470 [marine sediment metagenome]|uniref:Uncharacterized protein n=1 Tax=marine sediment metagenome TaxID=412755 RepID=A0A0F9XNY4_9ZZZZ